MADIKTITSDPDFWAPDTTDEQRSFVLSKNDKNFANADQATRAKLLKSLADQNKQGQQIAQKETAQAEQGQSWWHQNIAQPLNNIVGQGMESLATPFVPLARMAQGEGVRQSFSPESFTTQGAGGAAQQTREQAAAPVVPQEPWQAAMMAAGPAGKALGGVAPVLQAGTKMGSLARIGLGAGLGAAGEAAMGQTGQEGDSALGRALKGGTKAGLATGAVEALSGLSGLLGRHGPGAEARIAAEDQGRTAQAIGKTVPEFAGANPKGPAYGQFFQEGGAKSAAEAAFSKKVEPLDDAVAQWGQTSGTWIKSPELDKAVKMLQSTYKNKPGFQEILQDIQPDPHMGYLPTQAAKILARTREALVGSGNERMSGHMAQEAVDNILQDVIRHMPADAAKKFLQAREGFAAASSVRDLMDKGFQRGQKGYMFDIRGPQSEIGNPDITRRLPDTGQAIKEAVMRGKNTPPGSMDVMPKNSGYVPFPSVHGVEAAAVKYGTHGRKFVGQKPLTATQGQRGSLKALLGSGASTVSKATEEK